MGKLLVANRGEIACRILRTCRERGIPGVAVYSEADAGAAHVAAADEAWPVGPPPAARSYLDTSAILDAARRSGADAVHPGYGFLSENADFARACIEQGLTWVGPDPDSIRLMGDKERAREAARAAGVPVLPGSARLDDADPAAILVAGAAVGFPLLVKAAAGGGGIGMRQVDDADALPAQVEATCALARRSFGDGAVYLEHYVASARHVEVQVFGDGEGGGIHVFDRDCSVQRRFQKVIEEAPAPALPPAVRTRMREAALALVAASRYRGAGTVEFIYDRDREAFYFLEMNTRIQVEHAVTEMITGVDLVGWQLELAAGGWLAPSTLTASGAAIECRIYAERPEKRFLPSPGTLDTLVLPSTDGRVRVDSGVREGDAITPYYDPMIAKIIVRGDDRDDAIERTLEALSRTRIEGVSSNLSFLQQVLRDPVFRRHLPTTRYVEQGSYLDA